MDNFFDNATRDQLVGIIRLQERQLTSAAGRIADLERWLENLENKAGTVQPMRVELPGETWLRQQREGGHVD